MASPPLAAGSGGEGSSGSAGSDPSDRQLSALFEQAAERLPALLPSASKEQLLYLYARYKQVRRGALRVGREAWRLRGGGDGRKRGRAGRLSWLVSATCLGHLWSIPSSEGPQSSPSWSLPGLGLAAPQQPLGTGH